MLYDKWIRVEVSATISELWKPRLGMSGKIRRVLCYSVQEWMLDNFGTAVNAVQDANDKIFFVGTNGNNTVILKFKNEDDAILFKMRWC